MTPDSEAFIQQSLLPQLSPQPAAAASTALTAVVLRPPLSTTITTTTSPATTKTTVISLTQTPHSKPGLVMFFFFFFAITCIGIYWWTCMNKWMLLNICLSLLLSFVCFLLGFSFLVFFWMCTDSTPATGDHCEATSDAGSVCRGNTERTNSQSHHRGPATGYQTATNKWVILIFV